MYEHLVKAEENHYIVHFNTTMLHCLLYIIALYYFAINVHASTVRHDKCMLLLLGLIH